MTAHSASFPKAERLTKSQEFRDVLSKGKSVRENGIVFYWRQRDGEETASRIGLLASRKAAKKAVVRNRFKRAARELFRQTKNRFEHRLDVVVRALALKSETSFTETKETIAHLFEKSGVFKK